MDKMEKWLRQATDDDAGGVYLMIGTSMNDLKNKTIEFLYKIKKTLMFRVDHAGVRIGKTIIYFILASDEHITGKISLLNVRDVYFDDSVSMQDMSVDALEIITKSILCKGFL